MTLYEHRPDMCLRPQYQCISMWVAAVHSASLSSSFWPWLASLLPNGAWHRWVYFQRPGPPPSTFRKQLFREKGTSFKDFAWRKWRSFTAFHGLSCGFQGLSWSSTGFQGFPLRLSQKRKVLDGFYFWTFCCPCIVSQCGVWVCLGWATYQDPHMHNNACMGFPWGL